MRLVRSFSGMSSTVGCFVAMFIAIQFGFGLDVAEDELRRAADVEIQFTNYEGPVETSQSFEQILGIGAYLSDQQPEYFGRYSIVRAVDPTVVHGFDADIFFIHADARVDHIDNVRAIISGYVQQKYEYTSASASLVARLATIYNAVYRRNIENFQARYKQIVLEYLDEEHVGISTHYSDWPGSTQVVIPLRAEGAVIDPFELADDAVIEDLRTRRDMGIEDRKAIVDLMDDVIDREVEDIDEERLRIAAELEELEEREQELLEEREAVERDREAAEDVPPEERERVERELAEQEREIAEREAEAAERREQVAEDEESVAERDERLDEMEQRAQEVRDDVAEDQDEIMEDEQVAVAVTDVPADEPEEVARTVYALELSSTSPTGLSRLALVDVRTGEVLDRSETDSIVSRALVAFGPEGEFLLLLSSDSDNARAVLFDQQSMTAQVESTQHIYPGTMKLFHDDSVYLVLRSGAEYRLGRFNRSLELTDESEVSVLRNTVPVVDNGEVILQRPDGSFVTLDAESLSAVETIE